MSEGKSVQGGVSFIIISSDDCICRVVTFVVLTCHVWDCVEFD